MENKTTVVLVGVGGYGAHVLRFLLEHGNPEEYTITGVVDPFAERSIHWPWIQEQQIPVFASLAEFYQRLAADLAIICTPAGLHKEHTLCALKNGSHVLCEKPLTPLVQDARLLEEAARAAGRMLAVGFQWSFWEGMLRLKRDILAGLYGAPVSMNAFISWQRTHRYFGDGWHGHLFSAKGDYVLDTVASNATAHYLHNIFFLLGDALDTSLCPTSMCAALYRGHPIESYDTCFLHGRFETGADFTFVSTHCADAYCDPTLRYQFERGHVGLDPATHELIGYPDGKEPIAYGNVYADEVTGQKLLFMLRAARTGETPPCTVQTVLPHLRVCNAVLDLCTIHEFPQELKYESEEPVGVRVRGLYDIARACYEQSRVPSELAAAWAQPETEIDLTGYHSFSGDRLRGARPAVGAAR